MITKLTTKKAFMARAAELGCTVEDDGESLKVDAPHRHVFATTFNHAQDIWYLHDGWKKGEAYTAMMEDMSMGVKPCDDAKCEWCNGE